MAAPRLVYSLTGGDDAPPVGTKVWGDSALALAGGQPGRKYRNIFTGETAAVFGRGNVVGLSLAEVFSIFPVAALTAAEEAAS